MMMRFKDSAADSWLTLCRLCLSAPLYNYPGHMSILVLFVRTVCVYLYVYILSIFAVLFYNIFIIILQFLFIKQIRF